METTMAIDYSDFEPVVLGLAATFEGRADEEIYNFFYGIAKGVSDKIANSDPKIDDFLENRLEVALQGLKDGLAPDAPTQAAPAE